MSLPEISRRCLSCGAAVRAGARFCPQCGRQMEAGPGDRAEGKPADESRPRGGAGAGLAEWGGAVRPESGGRVADAADVPSVLDSESAREWVPPAKEFAAFVGSSEGGAVGSPEDRAAESSEDGALRRRVGPPAGGFPPETRGAPAELRETREAAVEVPPAEARNVEAPAVEVPASEGRDFEAPAVETPAAAGGAGFAAGASGEEARGRVARVREGTRARVGKMKDEALVVLEEAPDDSGLRFVLTAAALFLLFIIILVLSTTVLR